jgi:hypothetical protein
MNQQSSQIGAVILSFINFNTVLFSCQTIARIAFMLAWDEKST